MSWNPTLQAVTPDAANPDAIETVIVPRARDLGEFEVRRALPAPHRQMVGPFILFDAAGPAEFVTGQGADVRPHPHIGLGTVTYLFRGEFQHRDSLGSNQMIHPGELNWMMAGRGVTHSERTSAETRKAPHQLFGIQTWLALPEAAEVSAPRFEHYGKAELPRLSAEGVDLTLVLGRGWGERAPANLPSDTFYAHATLAPGARLAMPTDHEDRGVYVVEGSVLVAGQSFDAGQMLVFRPGDPITVAAGPQGARIMALGGATLGGPRFIWWNFVASSRERIEHAKEEWRRGAWGEGLFDLPPDDRDEFIPAPPR